MLCLLLGQQNAQAQKNVVKLNLTPLVITDITVQYERVLFKKFSVAMGIGYIPDRPLPGFFPTIPTINNIKFSGYSLTPEIRIYPHLLKDAPRGFYLAPYLKYSKYNVAADFPWSYKFSYTDPNTGITADKTLSQDLNLKGSFSGIGGGLMIGKQWIIANHISLDWFIMGGHVGSGANLSVSTMVDYASFPVSNQADIEKNIQDKLNKIEPRFRKARVFNSQLIL